MAHYAQLDKDNVVVSVFVGRDEDDFVDDVTDWEEYYAPEGFTIKRTSYNTYGGVHSGGGEPFRMNYAGIGFTYDEDRDAFIPPKPYESWVLDEATCLWVAPLPYPEDGADYTWDEETQEWTAVENEVTP
jgi:hypothetical protein